LYVSEEPFGGLFEETTLGGFLVVFAEGFGDFDAFGPAGDEFAFAGLEVSVVPEGVRDCCGGWFVGGARWGGG